MVNQHMTIAHSYDQMSDVFYISVGQPERAVRYQDGEDGVLLRVRNDGTVAGVTVEDISYCWKGRESQLARTIAEALDLEVSAVAEILPN